LSVLIRRETTERAPATKTATKKIGKTQRKQKKFKVKFHHLSTGGKLYAFGDIVELDSELDWVKTAIANGQLEPVK